MLTEEVRASTLLFRRAPRLHENSSKKFCFAIDDDPSVRKGLARLLRSAGYKSEILESTSTLARLVEEVRSLQVESDVDELIGRRSHPHRHLRRERKGADSADHQRMRPERLNVLHQQADGSARRGDPSRKRRREK